MNACQAEQLEALVRDELDADEAGRLRLHVAACARCRGELQWLRAEAALVARRRAELAAQGLPGDIWQGVVGRMGRGVPIAAKPRAPHRMGWLMAAAAGACVLAGGAQVFKHGRIQMSDNSVSVRLFDGGGEQRRSARAELRQAVAPGAPLRLRLATRSADLRVEARKEPVLWVRSEGPARRLELRPIAASANAFDVLFDGQERLPSGDVELQVPEGSKLELRTVSGEVKLSGASAAEIETVSGDIDGEELRGPLALRTVSGDTDVHFQEGATPVVALRSVSGDLKLRGRCGGGCQIEVNTTSGDGELRLDDKSAYAVSFSSQSGELNDEAGLTGGRFAAGSGAVRFSSLSGSLTLQR